MIIMKKLYFSIAIILAFFAISCEDYSASSPAVQSVEVLEQTTNADGSVTVLFLFTCDARDDVVVWWGTDESNYDTYLELTSSSTSNEENVTGDYPSGESLQDPKNWSGENTYEAVYPGAGNYTIVVIATNIGDFADDIKQTEYKQNITIK